MAIHMLKIWVQWEDPPVFENGIFSASGSLLLSKSTVTNVLIYYSNPEAHRKTQYNTKLKGSREQGAFIFYRGISGRGCAEAILLRGH